MDQQLWDPSAVLGVYPHLPSLFCSGIMQSGTQCASSCGKPERKEAAILLDEMSAIDPTSRVILAFLTELAGLALCRRWHRDGPTTSQRRQVLARWRAKINAYNAAMAEQMRPSASSIMISSMPVVHSSPSSSSSSSSSESPHYTPSHSSTSSSDSNSGSSSPRAPPSSVSSISGTVHHTPFTSSPSISRESSPVTTNTNRHTPPATPQRVSREPSLVGNNTHSNITPSTPPGNSRASASSISNTSTQGSIDILPRGRRASSETRSQANESEHSVSVSAPNIRSRSNEPTHNHIIADEPLSNGHSSLLVSHLASPPVTPVTLHARHMHTAAIEPTPQNGHSTSRTATATSTENRRTRQAIVEACPVCMEDILSPDDAVWCRAQCGTNVHRSCFRTWRSKCLETFRNSEETRSSRRRVIVHGNVGEATPTMRDEMDREERQRKSITCVMCRSPWLNEYEL